MNTEAQKQTEFTKAPDVPTKKKQRLIFFIACGIAVALTLLYLAVFFTPKKVVLNFAGETCVPHLLIAPQLQITDIEEFLFTTKNELRVGPVVLASTTLCTTYASQPTPGEKSTSIALLNGLVFKKEFIISTPALPVVKESAFTAPVSSVLPLSLPLTQQDTIHTYQLSTGSATAPCTSSNAAHITCAIKELGLAPDTEYSLQLKRSYKEETPATVTARTIKTLLPLALKEAGLHNEQIIYTDLQNAQFTFDHPITKDVRILLTNTDTPDQKIAIDTQVDGAVLTLTFPKDMKRKATYALVLDQVIGENGSSLASPITTTFTLSGGPSVKSVSIGASNVAQNGSITLTFDQPLKGGVDVTRYISVAGVTGTIQRQSDATVTIKLTGAALCTPFTISVDKGLESGVSTQISDGPWSHTSRIVCGTSSVIGYSVKDRPIVAYYFGSGPTTILFTGAIHGNEKSAYSTMTGWVDHLQANAHKIPTGKRVVIVPNLNPDGIAANSRNNVNNVNLGRNFPTANWKADIETANGLLVNGGGTSALSEPEAKSLATLTQQLRPRLEISFHSQGRLVGANKFNDSVRIGEIYASTVGYRTMFDNPEAVMGYPMTGEYEDWMGESMGLPAILIELPSHSGNYVSSQLPALWKMVNI